ncbi:TetR/AcrR family transcriptional regulator [Herbaspirillum sp. RV1423]|uniref:TetR/AcrR family transcriptional regulator n=1 Tax=Herbaspirillum sp. RV1423 TaxID=1443993 RepID=UPI0004B71456|nr:TetR/AcrR family transcriptional regulator [Herbaspirillum sp. RV1423]
MRKSIPPTPSTEPEPAPVKLGLRERGKQEKRRRIKQAARDVFLEKGYDAATTREIAERADVAIGTLFVYAKDKRDLLMMIINDDLDQLNRTLTDALQDAPLIDQLTDFFSRRYQYWASEPRLSRPAVQETFDFLSGSTGQGPETARFYARRGRIVDLLSAIIKNKQDAGKICTEYGPDEIASLFMTIYLTEVRRWLSDEHPQVDAGISHLRKLMLIALCGVKPAPGEADA